MSVVEALAQLLLLAMPLADPAAEGYELLYRTPGRPWFVPSEVYYLYTPSIATRRRHSYGGALLGTRPAPAVLVFGAAGECKAMPCEPPQSMRDKKNLAMPCSFSASPRS